MIPPPPFFSILHPRLSLYLFTKEKKFALSPAHPSSRSPHLIPPQLHHTYTPTDNSGHWFGDTWRQLRSSLGLAVLGRSFLCRAVLGDNHDLPCAWRYVKTTTVFPGPGGTCAVFPVPGGTWTVFPVSGGTWTVFPGLGGT